MISLIQKIPSVSGRLLRRKPRVNPSRQLLSFKMNVHRPQVTRLNFLIIFFVSVFSSEPEFSTNDHVYHSYTGETIQDFSCPEADVEKLLLDLNTNKACGPDVITARMLRESASTIAPSLSRIFNISLKLGKLPSEWKSANITPVFKKGVKETVTNYRPISLTCLVVEVL